MLEIYPLEGDRIDMSGMWPRTFTNRTQYVLGMRYATTLYMFYCSLTNFRRKFDILS